MKILDPKHGINGVIKCHGGFRGGYLEIRSSQSNWRHKVERNDLNVGFFHDFLQTCLRC